MLTTPSLFITGAPKSGTSALAAYLAKHPEVFFCQPKEPFYWSFDYPEMKRNLNLETLNDYLNLFAEATDQHTVTGEGSTNYLRSNCAIENILEFNPQAKMIAMLRNPVEVVHAYHSENLFAHWEDEPDFETAWRLQDDRLQGRRIPRGCPAMQLLQYREIASYSEQIERLFKLVPAHQRKVIIFDDFKSDTRAVFNQTVEFLDLPPFEMETFERVNAAHGHKSKLLAKLVLDPPAPLKPVVESLRHFLRKFQGGVIEKAKMAMRSKEQRKPMRPEFKSELETYFADDVEKLSSLLGRDLMHWVNAGTSPKAANRQPVSESHDTQTSDACEIVVAGGKN